MRTGDFETLLVQRQADVLFVTLNVPHTRNALSPEVVAELGRALATAETDAELRALVLRGAGGFFCAGGNMGSFQARLDAGASGRALADDPVATANREFGRFMQRLASLPVPLVAAVEGAAMGGGLGLACAADLVLATADAKFALSETSLGIVPAQIAPFVVQRTGRRIATRLGLTGERVSGEAAVRLGLVDELAADSEALDALLAHWLGRIGACAPHANRELKPLLRRCGNEPVGPLLDDAALAFSRCLRDEGAEGIAAFREKRAAAWLRELTPQAVRAARLPAPAAGGSGA
ncbi:enoyl-CoA hydratase-related protein [Ramlibacter tataouinensis]|uniref:enoyl-CoA hydratase/isomerase family protein n=1 Tax=Ramlibacter tataouinensis TaxID=94132 RepID=UPI0022F4026D|nr:enoyl-CoA hydratase-related protein [Ramlibacter tataouinensis]WBY02873.1 enoyl-CoA hydratase-related protein [Ramlibacter tataouinensis]